MSPSEVAALGVPKEDGTLDRTHLSPAGSALFGALVAEELARVVPDLAPAFRTARRDLFRRDDGPRRGRLVRVEARAPPREGLPRLEGEAHEGDPMTNDAVPPPAPLASRLPPRGRRRRRGRRGLGPPGHGRRRPRGRSATRSSAPATAAPACGASRR